MGLSLRVNTAKPDQHPITIQTAQGALVVRVVQRPGMGSHQALLTFEGPREIFTILRGRVGDVGDEGGGGDGEGTTGGRERQPDASEGAQRAPDGR